MQKPIRFMLYVMGPTDPAYRFNACFPDAVKAAAEARWYHDHGYAWIALAMPDGLHKYDAILGANPTLRMLVTGGLAGCGSAVAPFKVPA